MDGTLEINDELIGNYVNGNLNDADHKRVDKKINADKSLGLVVDVHAILIADNKVGMKSFFSDIITEFDLKPEEFDYDAEQLSFIESDLLMNSELNSVSEVILEKDKDIEIEPDLSTENPEKKSTLKSEVSLKINPEKKSILKSESSSIIGPEKKSTLEVSPKINPEKKSSINSDVKSDFGLLKVAAAFLLFCLVGSGLYFSLGSSSQNVNQLADNFIANHYNAPTILRSNSQQIDSDWQNAVKFYKSSDFSSSLKFTGIVTNRVPDNAEYNFYHGLNNLYSPDGSIEDAINTFDKVTNSSNLFEAASWYKALAYLKINKESQAKALFEKIASNPKSLRSKDAAKLLKSLKGN